MRDLMGMMGKMKEMQAKMEQLQQDIAAVEVDGVSGGGMVNVKMTGKGEMISIKIDPTLLSEDDAEMLEDLFHACDDDGSCLQFDVCGVCDGPGLAEGTCDCDGNVLDAVGVCGGGCLDDVDGDGVCDSEDGCLDVDACNYLEPNTTECDFCSCAEGVAEGTGLVLETFATDVEGGLTCYHLFLEADAPGDCTTQPERKRRGRPRSTRLREPQKSVQHMVLPCIGSRYGAGPR